MILLVPTSTHSMLTTSTAWRTMSDKNESNVKELYALASTANSLHRSKLSTNTITGYFLIITKFPKSNWIEFLKSLSTTWMIKKTSSNSELTITANMASIRFTTVSQHLSFNATRTSPARPVLQNLRHHPYIHQSPKNPLTHHLSLVMILLTILMRIPLQAATMRNPAQCVLHSMQFWTYKFSHNTRWGEHDITSNKY